LTDNPKNGIEYARYIKKKRAAVKRSLKSKKVSLKDFVSGNIVSEDIMNMKVIDLISSLPGIGRVNAEKIMSELKIKNNKRLLGLGKLQKERFYKYFKLHG